MCYLERGSSIASLVSLRHLSPPCLPLYPSPALRRKRTKISTCTVMANFAPAGKRRMINCLWSIKYFLTNDLGRSRVPSSVITMAGALHISTYTSSGSKVVKHFHRIMTYFMLQIYNAFLPFEFLLNSSTDHHFLSSHTHCHLILNLSCKIEVKICYI